MSLLCVGWALLGWTAASHLSAGELEDLQLIRRAYADQLYLYVGEKAQSFLSSPRVDLEGEYAEEVRGHMVAALVERGAFQEALVKMESIQQHSPGLTYFKARALYGAYVEPGEPLPEGTMRPSDMISEVLPHLKGEEKVMAEYVRCQDLFEIGAMDQASVLLKALVDGEQRFRHAEEVKFLYARSLYHLPEGQYREALDIFEELAQKHPQSIRLSRYFFWQGECHFEINQLSEAENAFKKALAVTQEPETKVDLYYNLGWLYVAMGRLDEGIRQLEMVLAEPISISDRYQSSSRYKLASIRLMQKQPEVCREVLQPILKDSALEHEASLLSAQASMMLDQWERALEDLNHASESVKDEVRLEANRLLGKVYLKLNDYEKAEGILKYLVEREVPLDFRINVQLQLAEIYFEMNDIYRAQNIYTELLAEKSRKLEPMLHYNLARCAMYSNPLIECVFKRDQCLELQSNGMMSFDPFEQEKEFLNAKVKQIMSRVWIMATSSNASFSKSQVLEVLSSVSGITQEAKLAELKARYLDEQGKIPSDIGLESALFNAMVDEFLKAFWKVEKLSSYEVAKEAFGVLGIYSPALQVMKIHQHLDHIIDMGEESPYLSLAYYEKSRVYAQQSLTGDEIESLHHAISHTAEPEPRSRYLLQLAITEIQLAKKIQDPPETFNGDPKTFIGDPKTVKFKVQKALGHLDEVTELLPHPPVELIDWKFVGYRMLLDYDAAERVITDYLETTNDLEVVSRLEEQLISFYYSIGREIKSAQRRLIYAGRLEKSHPVEAQHQRYEAALILLESKQGHEEGANWLKKLSESKPDSTWSFRAGLKCVDIQHRQGKIDGAQVLLSDLMERGRELDLSLRLEVQMSVAQQAVFMDDHAKASEAYESVMKASADYPAIKAKATIELGKALKVQDPARAADIFLQFYYLFPTHSKSQVALFESCRLRARLLKNWSAEERQLKVNELQRLVAKLENQKERRDLKTYIAGLL